MIKLKIDRTPRYLSPSSLKKAVSQPNTFYLERLLAEDMSKPREPQGKAAAAGTAFDILVKQMLMLEHGVPCKNVDGIEGIKNSLERHHDWAYDIGAKMLKVYSEDAKSHEKIKWVYVDGSEALQLPCPGVSKPLCIIGKPDAAIDLGMGKPVSLDWKVVGANASSGVSPKPGFYAKYTPKKGWDNAPHKLAADGNVIPAQYFEPAWADQLCTYNWQMGWKPAEEHVAAIHSVVFNGKDRDIIVVKYLVNFDLEFQARLLSEYQSLWAELQLGHYINRLASDRDLDVVVASSFGESWF